MNPKDFAKIFTTVILAPTAAYIAINGSNHGDGSQVTVAIAIMTLLGAIWGPPGSGKSGGGSHAA